MWACGPWRGRGTLTLEELPGWEVRPARVSLAQTPVEERFDFTVHRIGATGTEGSVAPVATVGGKTYREGYQTIEHRNLWTRYLFREARRVLRAVDVTLSGDLAVGHVMGIRDALPAAIGQLGARVQLLKERVLATGQLDRFDAIVVGTRAYTVRTDVHQFNDRLLGYAERGGHLIVLYNTQEFDPSRHAPFPGEFAASSRGSLGGGCGGRPPGAGPPGPAMAEPDRVGGLRGLGGTAGLEVSERLGPRPTRPSCRRMTSASSSSGATG